MGHLVYTITLLIMEAHNNTIYPVCLYNGCFYKKLSKATYLVRAGELINDLMTLYKAIQHYPMLYKTLKYSLIIHKPCGKSCQS